MPKGKGYGTSKMKPIKRRGVFKLTKTKHNPMFKARKKSY